MTFLLLACLVLAAPIHSQATTHTIAVVLSQKIKPYMQVLKGLQQGLDKENNFYMDVFFLSTPGSDGEHVKKNLLKKSYDLFVAIGPEAGSLIWSMAELRHQGKLFSAILNPHKVDHMKDSHCGISLQIPVSTQLAEINAALPTIKTIGLLFDLKHNQFFFEKAWASGIRHSIKIIPLSVTAKSDIARVLKDNLNKIDCIWMIPDPTVISEKIVQYVIRQALYQKKGVIGYNTYFIKSGAIFAFEFDYHQIGIQTADKTRTYFNGQGCNTTVPFFQTTINSKMLRHLGMTMGEKQE